MSKFPKGTTFTANNETDGFMCIEMKTERPWTYQVIIYLLYGVSGWLLVLVQWFKQNVCIVRINMMKMLYMVYVRIYSRGIKC